MWARIIQPPGWMEVEMDERRFGLVVGLWIVKAGRTSKGRLWLGSFSPPHPSFAAAPLRSNLHRPPGKIQGALERKQQPSLRDEDCMNIKAMICQSAQSGCAKTQSRVEVHDSSSAFGLWGDWWWREIHQCAHWRSVHTCNWIWNLGHIWMLTTATLAVDQGPAESKVFNTAWWGHHVCESIQVELLQLISLSLHWMRRRIWEQS